MRSVAYCVALAGLLPLVAMAQAPENTDGPAGLQGAVPDGPPSLPLCGPMDLAADINNPAGDAAQRRQAFVALVASGPKASSFDKFQVGVHFRNGADHPAPLVNRDVGEARQWLSHAAVAGEVYAMASVAELELAEGNAMDAMIWAQAYAKYAAPANGRDGRDDRAYQADLLRRIFKELPEGKQTEERIQTLLDAFVDRYGEAIERHRERSSAQAADERYKTCRSAREDYPLRMEKAPREVVTNGTRAARGSIGFWRPGLALFRVRVGQDGVVRDVLVIESLPGPATAKVLLPTVQAIRFNAIDPQGPIRDAIVPLSYSDGSVRLRD